MPESPDRGEPNELRERLAALTEYGALQPDRRETGCNLRKLPRTHFDVLRRVLSGPRLRTWVRGTAICGRQERGTLYGHTPHARVAMTHITQERDRSLDHGYAGSVPGVTAGTDRLSVPNYLNTRSTRALRGFQ